MTIISAQLIAFARGLSGGIAQTKSGLPFTVIVKGNDIYVTPHSTGIEQRRFTESSIQAGLAIYHKTASLSPSDYSTKIAHSSYFVGLLQGYLNMQSSNVG